MSFAPEAKENWPPDSEEKKSEDLEAKEVAAPDPEASESKGSTPPNSNPLKDEAFGDTRLDRIHDILRGMQPLSKDAEKERAEILGIVEGFRSKACRYDYEILQKVVKILEKAETRQDDNLEADGTRPSWIRRAVRRLPFRRRDPNSDQSTDSQLQALRKVKPLLKDLKDNPYVPSPHGGPATVAAKKLVQFGKVVVSSFSVVPGAAALGQALEALDTHLTAMANEGDYVADAKASMAGIHGVLSPLETTTGAQSSTQALQNVNNVVTAMEKDVEDWVKLPKALKYTAPHPGGVSRAVDFEMRMQIHNNNFKDALLVSRPSFAPSHAPSQVSTLPPSLSAMPSTTLFPSRVPSVVPSMPFTVWHMRTQLTPTAQSYDELNLEMTLFRLMVDGLPGFAHQENMHGEVDEDDGSWEGDARRLLQRSPLQHV